MLTWQQTRRTALVRRNVGPVVRQRFPVGKAYPVVAERKNSGGGTRLVGHCPAKDAWSPPCHHHFIKGAQLLFAARTASHLSTTKEKGPSPSRSTKLLLLPSPLPQLYTLSVPIFSSYPCIRVSCCFYSQPLHRPSTRTPGSCAPRLSRHLLSDYAPILALTTPSLHPRIYLGIIPPAICRFAQHGHQRHAGGVCAVGRSGGRHDDEE